MIEGKEKIEKTFSPKRKKERKEEANFIFFFLLPFLLPEEMGKKKKGGRKSRRGTRAFSARRLGSRMPSQLLGREKKKKGGEEKGRSLQLSPHTNYSFLAARVQRREREERKGEGGERRKKKKETYLPTYFYHLPFPSLNLLAVYERKGGKGSFFSSHFSLPC